MSNRASIIMPTVSFTTEPLPMNIIGDLKPLNALNDEQLNEIYEICSAVLVNQTTNPSASEEEAYDPIEERFQAFLTKQSINDRPMRLAISALLFIFNQSINQSINPDSLSSDLTSLGLNEQTTLLLSERWKKSYASFNQFLRANLQSINHPINQSINQLVDFQWKFGVTAASSEINVLGRTFLQCQFSISQADGSIKKVLTELTLPQFYSFLHAMQSAARTADSMHQ